MALFERIEVRAALHRGQVLAQDVVNFLLLGLHALDVAGQRHPFVPGRRLRGTKAQQGQQALHAGHVGGDTLFDETAEFLPEGAVIVRFLARQGAQFFDQAAGQRLLNLHQQAVSLHRLA